MTVESAKKFIEKLKNDSKFRNEFIDANSEKNENIKNLLNIGGFDFTKDEMREVIGEMSGVSITSKESTEKALDELKPDHDFLCSLCHNDGGSVCGGDKKV